MIHISYFFAGVPVRSNINDDSGLMHQKICLIDTVKTDETAEIRIGSPIQFPKQGVLMAGSQNWTSQVIISWLDLGFEFCYCTE